MKASKPIKAEAEERPAPVLRAGAIGGAALIIMAANFTSSGFGFVRQAVTLGVFGQNARTDAFTAASYFPQMFYDITIGAAISAALIPTFASIVQARGRDHLWPTLSSVLTVAWLVLGAMSALLVLAAGPIMSVILWGYHQRPEDLRLTIDLARLLVPTLLFLGTSAVLLSALYSLRSFTAPAFASSMYHIGIIVAAIALARPLGIFALPVGAIVGSLCQVVVQVPTLLRQRPHLRPRFSLTPEARQILRLYAPVAAGLLVSIAGQVIDLGFKSTLARGSIVAMQTATTLTQFPIGIAVAAMSFAILPTISADAALGRIQEFKDTLATGLRFVLFITIPAAVGYLVLATPIISLLFEHKKFTSHDTTIAALALVGYSIQIPFVGVDQLLIFAFYARKNTVTPMLIGIVGVGIYIATALLLKPRFQIFGLALANTIQNSLHGLILLALLLAALGSLAGRGMLRSIATSCTAAVVMAVGAATSAWLMGSYVPSHRFAQQAADALVPIAIGGALYFGVALLLRSDELRRAWAVAQRRRA